MRYAVGFMSYEIWTNSSGVWTTKPPREPSTIEAPYTFSFPGRTVNNVRYENLSREMTINRIKASRNGEQYDDTIYGNGKPK